VLQGELKKKKKGIRIYSFHVIKRPRMVIVVLPMVPGNNYFILEGEYSGEMTPSMVDAGSGPVCLTSVERNSDGRLLSLS
jgi:hypothetical protein